ncbi:MAG: hypothetical protein COA78_24975 [Blastopirellula sp.]|nr:MAG: hypothetical protein COA78_24975 [Blastopirellula sp.]
MHSLAFFVVASQNADKHGPNSRFSTMQEITFKIKTSTQRTWIAGLSLLLFLTLSIDGHAQSQPMNSRIVTDTLLLKTGETRTGLITSENNFEIELMEIERPPGRPSFAVVRVYSKVTIDKILRINQAERSRLETIAERMRNRVQIEAKQLSEVRLKEIEHEGEEYLHFAGHGFVLLSRVDESLTRKIAVRADQVFRAFRHTLPVQVQSDSMLRIIVLGSSQQYKTFTQQIGLTVVNPAVYLPEQNLIVISTNLELFSQRLKLAIQEHDAQREQWKQQEGFLPQQLVTLGKQLRLDGYNKQAIDSELAIRKLAWQKDRDSNLRQLQTADRRNQTQLDHLLSQALRRLSHESFHAYLENFVFPHNSHDVPIWLNEGLAQLFEHGQLEDEMFRIDQPPAEFFQRIQKSLDRDQLSVAKLLLDDRNQFLFSEALHHESTQYDAAWAMVWYLIYRHQLLEGEKLSELVRINEPEISIEQKLSNLTGKTLAEYDAAWKEYLTLLGRKNR